MVTLDNRICPEKCENMFLVRYVLWRNQLHYSIVTIPVCLHVLANYWTERLYQSSNGSMKMLTYSIDTFHWLIVEMGVFQIQIDQLECSVVESNILIGSFDVVFFHTRHFALIPFSFATQVVSVIQPFPAKHLFIFVQPSRSDFCIC